MLEAGTRVILTVKVTIEADQVKFLAQSVRSADEIIAETRITGLRLFVGDSGVFPVLARLLEKPVVSVEKPGLPTAKPGEPTGVAAKGRIHVILCSPGFRDVEMELGRDYLIDSQLKSALKPLDGILRIEDVW